MALLAVMNIRPGLKKDALEAVVASEVPVVVLVAPVGFGKTELANTFEHVGCEYDYECDIERWRQFNGDLRVRSAVIVPLFCQSQFCRLLATGWTTRNAIDEMTAAVAETIASLVEIVSDEP